ncbi:uncharacterized protein LOC129909640 [Episyrphus balteatus]|uniref:uncharacterized protein LOC129909640 n=1 Tax=Episyrphus balteatus TaxID=286459 RepID=UPI002484D91A|nr:uncharacterized protein LOC129909640 [Episyrphus balteatus]
MYHPKCINLAEYDIAKTIEPKPYLVILCELCRDKLVSLRHIEEHIKEIKANFDQLGVKFEKVLNSDSKDNSDNKIISTIKKTINENLNSDKKSYASAVKKSTIIIKPKEHQNAEKTKSEVKSSVNPGTSSIQVSGIKKVDKGAIVVSCENDESMKRVRDKVEENLGQKYDVNELKRNNPRVQIFNLSEKMDENELINCLKNQNEILKDVNLVCKAMWKKPNKNSYTAVIELDSKSFNEVMKAGKLSVGWDKCLVKESFYVKRCFKCLGFNHNSKDCKAEKCNNLLIQEQSGFRSGHSCETAINCVVWNWKRKIDCGHSIVAVFLDLKRAFETIDRQILLSKLRLYGVCHREWKWFESYLTNRSQRTSVNGVTSDAKVNNLGVPQGSVLGVMKLFADDSLIYICGKNGEDMCEKLNDDLKRIDVWLKMNKLKVNVTKTKYMKFGMNEDIDVKMDSESLICVESIKYLGCVIDRKLNLKEHASHKTKGYLTGRLQQQPTNGRTTTPS